eukprot:CAMPEP_0185758020 /NCGR_PEP_ID=MMETSP1174-20130828/16562_1 /TAXON_ID=35687 /ORGANISM="Dictyocha speculum, Strain CCMP1381" /LENGTH=156 /DNA_ID=CAMNT_0028437663 /DNA_START=259 /DNA_END=729 /DNA_ORIENTATION=+
MAERVPEKRGPGGGEQSPNEEAGPPLGMRGLRSRCSTGAEAEQPVSGEKGEVVQVGVVPFDVRVGVVADDVLLVPCGDAHVCRPQVRADGVDPWAGAQSEMRAIVEHSRRSKPIHDGKEKHGEPMAGPEAHEAEQCQSCAVSDVCYLPKRGLMSAP